MNVTQILSRYKLNILNIGIILQKYLVWKDFKATIPTKVEDITIIDATEVERFDLSGRKITKPVQGVNIVRYSDGSVRKETR